MKGKFKQILSSFLVAVMLVGILPAVGVSVTASAATYSGSYGSYATWKLDSETGTLVISGSGALPNSSWDSYSGSADSSQVKYVVIEEGITSVGSYAFEEFYNLVSATLPSSVKSVGRYAFSDCGIESITLSEGLETIDYGAFIWSMSLKSIDIPDSVKIIGDNAFAGCSSLRTVTIGSGVSEIGDDFLSDAFLLEKITVDPKNRHYSSDDSGALYNFDKTALLAFPHAASIEEFVIPASVCNEDAAELFLTYFGTIGVKRFTVEAGNPIFSSDRYGVLFDKYKSTIIRYPSGSEMTQYTIPSTVIELSHAAFTNSNNLTDIVVSEGVREIGYEFLFCENLRTISLPSTVFELEPETFLGCVNLEKIIVSEDNPFYGTNEEGSLFYKEANAIMYVPAKSVGESYVIPDTTEYIAETAFIDCSDFSLTIPATVDDLSYVYMISANEFIVDKNHPTLASVDGCLYDKNVTTLYKYPIDSNRQYFEFPSTVEEIINEEVAFCSYNSKTFVDDSEINIQLSDYNMIRCPDNLTLHATFDTGMLMGVNYIYLCGDAAKKVNQYNNEMEAVRKEITAEVNNAPSYSNKDLLSYKLYVTTYTNLLSKLPVYIACDGEHNPIQPETSYKITVSNGTASQTSAKAGEIITLTANVAPVGKEFEKWIVTGVNVADATSTTVKFTMPAGDVTATAIYKEKTITPPTTSYKITVSNGVASKATAGAGEIITLVANAAPAGKEFDKWIITGAIAADTTKSTTTFTMPAGNVTATATYKTKVVAVPSIKIENPSNKIQYKSGTTLYAIVENLPEGAVVEWSANNGCFVLSSNGSECVATSVENGTTTMTAKIKLADGTYAKDSTGNVICDSVEITSEYVWWQWIIVILLFGWIWY